MFAQLRNLLRAVAVLTAAVSFFLGSAVGYTDGTPIQATRQDYCFDNSGILIGGYCFDLKNANSAQVGYIKEAGIDFMISSVNETFLNLCDEYGVGVIAKNYNASSMYYMTYGNTSWYNITPETYKDHPCLWGDDLIDEPTSQEFETLNAMAAHYLANTQGKLPYINLFPIYANSEQLGNEPDIPFYRKALSFGLGDSADEHVDMYKRHVSDYINAIDTDYISVDIYPLGCENNALGRQKTTNELWLRNLDILAEACRATGRDLWVITQAAGNEINDGGGMRYCDTPEDIRWQAYVSLSFGAKAIIHACYNSGWWDSESHLIDQNGNRTDTYYAVQAVNTEIKAISDAYARYDNQGAYLVNRLRAAGTKTGYLLPVDEALKPSVQCSNPLLIGCFTEKQGEGKAYTVVNMTEPQLNKTVSATLSFDGASRITVYKTGVATVYDAANVDLELASGEGVFITVE